MWGEGGTNLRLVPKKLFFDASPNLFANCTLATVSNLNLIEASFLLKETKKINKINKIGRTLLVRYNRLISIFIFNIWNNVE